MHCKGFTKIANESFTVEKYSISILQNVLFAHHMYVHLTALSESGLESTASKAVYLAIEGRLSPLIWIESGGTLWS